MPPVSGLELATRQRADGSVLPIILSTGSTVTRHCVRTAELGIKEVLEMPSDEANLLAFIYAAIRRVWQRKAGLSRTRSVHNTRAGCPA
jgi:DNA-binding response OmpR family regulator